MVYVNYIILTDSKLHQLVMAYDSIYSCFSTCLLTENNVEIVCKSSDVLTRDVGQLFHKVKRIPIIVYIQVPVFIL